MYIIYKYASNSYERGRLKNDEKIIPEMYRAIRYTNTCPLFHYSTIAKTLFIPKHQSGPHYSFLITTNLLIQDLVLEFIVLLIDL